jgi:hypothetical protein
LVAADAAEAVGGWTLLAPQAGEANDGRLEIDALMPSAESVSLDYRGHDGRPLRQPKRHTAQDRRVSRTISKRWQALQR